MIYLVIVESPAKIKSLKAYLGDNYDIMASIGHIRQLPKKELGIDIDNNYSPEYENIEEKMDVIKKMIDKSKKVDKVIFASDMDMEGEAIAWHCAEILKLPEDKRLRATFTSITKNAIITSINNTLETNKLINMNIVYAQTARMVLDKLIGYKICPLLWKEYCNFYLSCGRVQSVVVKLIIERENEITTFKHENIFKLTSYFTKKIHINNDNIIENEKHKKNKKDKKDKTDKKNKKGILHGLGIETINKIELKKDDEDNIIKLIDYEKNNILEWFISKKYKSETDRSPPPPFITSTLQQEASIKLGFTPEICMKLAQKCYESGLITYMRTDSPSISDDGMNTIKTYIINTYGDEYYRRYDYKSKSKSAQEGHECCRAVDINKETILDIDGITPQHNKLYNLIRLRTIASQMKPSKYEIHTIEIKSNITNKDIEQFDFINKILFIGKYEKCLFDGYKKIYSKNNNSINNILNNDLNDNLDDNDNDDVDVDDNKLINKEDNELENIFMGLEVGDKMEMFNLLAKEKTTKSIGRYTEASLISKMESLGIGRPSTYANIIKKIQNDTRPYVEKKTILPTIKKILILKYINKEFSKEEEDIKIDGEKNKLLPTSLGIMINNYLEKHFIDIMNYDFTSQIESLLDDISLGTKKWYDVVNSVYIKLNPIILSLNNTIIKNKKQNKLNIQNKEHIDTDKKRLLGNNPTNNIPIYAIKSKKGYLICEEHENKELSRFANFNSDFDLITLNDALKLLIYPLNLGLYNDHDIIIKKIKNIYISYNGKNYSIDNYNKYNKNNNIDPNLITLPQSIQIINYYNIKKEIKTIVLDEKNILKDGPFGAYIKHDNKFNIPLPKKLKTEWETLTILDCNPIIEKYLHKKNNTTNTISNNKPKKYYKKKT